MVLVDSSVWIDFFQNPDSPFNERLENLIKDHNRAVISGIVLQEILQGIKDSKRYTMTKEKLSKLPFINTDRETYLFASNLYRALRTRGITIPSVDATLAATAILNGIPIFTKDEHFQSIARHSELKLY